MNSNSKKGSNNSISILSNEKSLKLNKIINDSLNSFNKKFNTINNQLQTLQKEYNNQLNLIQKIINEDDNKIKFQYKKATTINDKNPYWELYQDKENENIGKKRHKSPISFLSESNKQLRDELFEIKKIVLGLDDNKNIEENQKNKVLKGIIRKKRSLTFKSIHSFQFGNLLNKLKEERKKTVSFNSNLTTESIFKKKIINNNKEDSKYNALQIIGNSLLIPDEEKLKLKFLDKKLYNKISTPLIYTDKYILELKDELNNSYSSDVDISLKENNEEELNKTIFPSKTAQAGINFIIKRKEELIYNDTSNLGKYLCNLLYIILELQDKYDKNKELKDLFVYFFEYYNIKSIKDLFLKVIYPKVYINEDVGKEIFTNFNEIISEHLSEIKLISKARNSPLSWIAINILEIDKYLEMIYKKEKYDKNKS